MTAASPIICIVKPVLPWREACKFIGVSPATGERLLRAGAIPKPFKYGHQRFFSLADLEAFLAARRASVRPRRTRKARSGKHG